MNDDRDIEQALGQWLVDGVDAMPDRVFVAVLDRVDRQPQALAPRLLRRLPDMTPFVRLAAIAAVVLVVAVIGIGVGPPAPDEVGQPVPTTTASIRPSPSAALNATPAVPVTPGATARAGAYRTWFTNVASVPGLTVDLTAPVDWQRFEDWAMFGPGSKSVGDPDAVAVGVFGVSSLFSDPCHWDIRGDGVPGPGDVGVGPTVDDLVSALRAASAYVTSRPEDVTVGGFPGQALDLVPPPDVDPRTCDRTRVGLEGLGSYRVFNGDEDTAVLTHRRGSRWHLRILDVAGTRVIVTVIDYPKTTPEARDAAQAIVDSMRFSP
jgi:hypothetical protein